VEACRAILGPVALQMSNQEIEQVRDQLYGIARTVIEVYNGRADRGPFNDSVSSLAEQERAEAEERAAIAEYDGKLSRDQAERLALAKYLMPRRRI